MKIIVIAYLKHLFLTIFVAISVVTMLCALAPNREISAIITVNVFLAFIILPIVVLLHELGHVVSSKLVGVRCDIIVLGTGKHTHLLRWGKLRILAADSFLSGHTFLSEYPNVRTKRRLALIYSGGVLAHLCIIGIVLIARRGNIPLFPPNHIDIPWSVSASNAYALIMALLPFSRRIGGSRVSSDGLRLIMLPFMNRERIAELKKSTDFVSVIENLLDGEIESARQELERLLKLYPDNPQGRLMLIRIYIQRLKFDEALFNLRRLLEHDKKANNDPVILNLMSWDLLLDDRRKNLAEAEQYALRAYRLRAFPKTTNTVALIRMLKGESEQAELSINSLSYESV